MIALRLLLSLFFSIALLASFTDARRTSNTCSTSASPLPVLHFETIEGPASKDAYAEWVTSLQAWRKDVLNGLQFNSSNYDLPELQWVRLNNTMQPLLMIHDLFFYDPSTGEYTVSNYLSDLATRYGGIESVLLWHSYPNIGVDRRNQWEMLESMPGYPTAVKAAVEEFNAHGVKVLLPYNPWDTGTHQASNSDEAEMALHIVEIGASGFNGDTMSGIPSSFFDVGVNLTGAYLLTQPEVGLSDDCSTLDSDLATWGYWDWSAIPPVSKYKYLEGRHLVQICERWQRDHRWNLLFAWFNGIGFVSWEDVWGIYLTITERDAEAIRRIDLMTQYFSDLLSPANNQWTPHYPTIQQNVYASQFEGLNSLEDLLNVVDTTHSDRLEEAVPVLYTLVNTDDNQDYVNAPQIQVPYNPDNFMFFDIYHGEQLRCLPIPRLLTNHSGEEVWTIYCQLNFTIHGAQDLGGILIISPSQYDNALQDFLYTMSVTTELPLRNYSTLAIILSQHVLTPARTNPLSAPPPGMLPIPSTSEDKPYLFESYGIEIEGDSSWDGVDFQYDLFGETVPRKNHSLSIKIDAFYIHQFPVTNSQYYDYLVHQSQLSNSTSLIPSVHGKSCYNFLRHWEWDWSTECTSPSACLCSNANSIPRPPAELSSSPVVWVGLQDAIAFCQSFGYRLANEWEWQYAGQGGNEEFLYPWGQQDDTTRTPSITNDRENPVPVDVHLYLNGSSPWGVMDMIANKWEWTGSVFVDSHTRRACLKGGSRYYPIGTQNWYFPQTRKLNEHGNYQLIDQVMDRSGFIGFRCVADATQQNQEEKIELS